MKKTLLALSIASVVSPFAVVAENNETNETMVVTASRTAQQEFDVLAAVDVFEREDIEIINPQSVADLLNRVAGISTTTNGSAGNNTSVFVRGGNSDHVLLLIDGVRVGSATLGNKDLGQVPMDMIERVEVIRGPRAALWGSDAIGGVIQIFTRQYESGKGVVGGDMGNYGKYKLRGAVGLGNDQHRYTVAASLATIDGYDVLNPDPNRQDDKDGYLRQSVTLNGVSKISNDYQLAVSAQFDKGNTEFDSGFGGDELDFENHFIQLSNQFTIGDVALNFNLANSADTNHDNAAALYSWAENSVYETERQQMNLLASLGATENIDLTGGIDWYKEEVTSHNHYLETERTVKAAYVVGRMSLDKIKLEGSVRRDEVGDTEAETTHQFAVGYQINDDVLVSYSQGTAFKAPTFNDLFWPDAFNSRGNPNLKSETADNKELMIRTRGDIYSVELSLYETEFENLIEWRYNPNTQYSSPTNVDDARVKGAELTLTMELFGTRNRLSLASIDAKNQATGVQLIRRPHFTGFYELFYQGDRWNTAFEVRHQGQRHDTGTRLKAFTIANLAFGYEASEDVDLRVKINNLFDNGYIQAAAWPNAYKAAYQGQGLNYSLSLDYRF